MITTKRRVAVEEAVAYGFLTALGGYAFITAFDYDILTEGNRVGPGLMPVVLGGLIAVMSGALLVRSLIGRRTGHDHGMAEVVASVAPDVPVEAGSTETADPGTGTDDVDIFGRTAAQRMRQLQVVTVALLVCLLLVPVVGLLLALGLFSLFASVVVERRPWVSSLVITAVSIATMYGVFVVFLEVPLPTGVLGIGG